MNITDQEIKQLQVDSQQAQNWPMAALCRKALNGDEAARIRVEKIITDAANARLMDEYLQIKDRYEQAVEDYQGAMDEMTRTRQVRDAAFAVLTDLKAREGEPTPDDKLCCQRYGRVHARDLAVPGCRWFEPEASRS